MSRPERTEKKNTRSRKSLARKITAQHTGAQISLLISYDILLIIVIVSFLYFWLCSTGLAMYSRKGAGDPDIPNILFDSSSIDYSADGPRGHRLIYPLPALLNMPNGTRADFEFVRHSNVSLVRQWADVRTLLLFPYENGKYVEILFTHNLLFFTFFRAFIILLIIQVLTVIRGSFRAARLTRQTLRPITDLTLAAQSINAAQGMGAAQRRGPSHGAAAASTGVATSTGVTASAAATTAARDVPDTAAATTDTSDVPDTAAATTDTYDVSDTIASTGVTASTDVAAAGVIASDGVTSTAAATANAPPAAAGQPGRDEPVLKLSGAIDTLNMITEQHLDRRIAIEDERVELKGLASAINGMLDRLDSAYQAQLRFVSDASHELRTPISVIQGYVNLLDRWGKNDEKTLQESINAIKNESENMQDLVEQLLFLARGDNRSIAFSLEDVDIPALLEEVARETEMIDQTHVIQVKAGAGLSVRGDYQLLKRALRILTDNSVKYTPSGGRIALGAAHSADRPGYLDITVKDSGIGIPEEALPFIFDRFFRADESRARSSGGTGLGLSIAKWIVDNHMGIIEVISRKDAGTKFTISIPEK